MPMKRRYWLWKNFKSFFTGAHDIPVWETAISAKMMISWYGKWRLLLARKGIIKKWNGMKVEEVKDKEIILSIEE